MERGVEHIDTQARESLRALADLPDSAQELDRHYSPRDFFRRFGAVIAICLGLALIANVLVTLTGT